MRRERVLLTLILVVVFLFQLLTIGFPGLNGDEAFFLLLGEEIEKIKSGVWPSLNPVIHYTGPLNFWILGSLYQLTGWLGSTFANPHPWVVRIIPLTLVWIGVWTLNQELKNWSKELSGFFLFVFINIPIVLVYSRIAWQHSIVLACCFFLLKESLRLSRTQELRWLRTGFWSALAMDSHTIGFIGVFVTLAPQIKHLIAACFRQPVRAFFCISSVLFLIYPVVRNFPPPIADPSTKSSIALQAASLLNTISGIHPFEFFLGRDPAPDLFLVPFLLFVFTLLIIRLVHLVRNSTQAPLKIQQFLLGIWISHTLAAIFIVYQCAQGRNLRFLGSERYFLSITPGWVLLQADALGYFCRNYLKKRHLQLFLLSLWFMFVFGRFSYGIWVGNKNEEPSFLASLWLEKVCPKSQCVAYAENFWNYWPIRFYSRDRIFLNFIHYNWKDVLHYTPQGKKIAGCWYEFSAWKQPDKYTEKIIFTAAKRMPSQICYLGINPPR